MKKFMFLSLLLSGCGFTPLYHHQSLTYQNLQNLQIIIEPIPDEYGSDMYRILKNQIPTATQTPKKTYVLSVQPPTFTGYDKTITNDEFASTIQATGHVYYKLIDQHNNQTLQEQDLSMVSSYTVDLNPYATTVAKNKVYKELSEQLAQQIGLNVIAFVSKETP